MGQILRRASAPMALGVLLISLVLSRGTLSPTGYALALALALAAMGLLTRTRGVPQGQARLWVLYLVGFVLFAHLRSLTDATGIAAQTGYVIDMEQALFFGQSPTVWLQERLFHGGIGLIEALSTIVYVTYFLAPHVVALLIWRYRPALFARFVAAILGVVYIGLLVSLVVPTTPPWLAAGEGALPPVDRIVRLTLGALSSRADGAYDVVGPNAVAAMPSLHMALTVIILAAAWGSGRGRRLAAAGYVLAMGFALVYGAEHYVVDLLVGALIAALVWRATRRLERPAAAMSGRGVCGIVEPDAAGFGVGGSGVGGSGVGGSGARPVVAAAEAPFRAA